MKKLTILLVLMAMMTTMAFAYLQPEFTYIDTETYDTELSCFGYNGDAYCLAENSASDYFFKYEVGTGTLTELNNLGNLGQIWMFDCDEYSGVGYCYGEGGTMFSLDLITGVKTDLTGTIYTSLASACVFKEGTDEFWCFGGQTADDDVKLKYYDVSEDTWYHYASYTTEFTVLSDIYFTDCQFDSNEPDLLWCAGGYGDLGSGFQALPFIYNVNTATNTTTEYNISPYQTETAKIKVVDYEVYVLGGDDGSNPINTAIVFHPSNGTYTELNVMPEYFGWYGCADLDDYNDICLNIYDATWGYVSNIYTVNYGVGCEEDWQPYYTACDVTDEMTLYYLDLNTCGTFDNLPLDNSTQEYCNYCTPTYEETSLDCVAGDTQRDITYEYTNTCCADTGLPTDCTKPEDTTESCIGIHTSSDVPNVVIDFGVEYGRGLIALAGLFVVFGLGFWAYKSFKKR